MDSIGCASRLFPRHSLWMPDWVRPDEGPVRGPLMFGDILSALMTTPECVAWRLQTINWIQAKLRNQTSATCGKTMGAIMILSMWEVRLNAGFNILFM